MRRSLFGVETIQSLIDWERRRSRHFATITRGKCRANAYEVVVNLFQPRPIHIRQRFDQR